MEAIFITKMGHVVDNWGKTETTENEQEIIDYLRDPEGWDDDTWFIDASNREYWVDDLVDKKVQVGHKIFNVIEDEKTAAIMKEIDKVIDPVLKLKETLKELVAKYPEDVELGRSVRRLNLD